MNQIWLVAVAIAALVIISRIRSRKKTPVPRQANHGVKLFGHQINAYLHPRMGTACIYDNGLQYGRGFRRKEGPKLPHDAACRCEAVPFKFTSSDVFNGALRDIANIQGSIPGLPMTSARLLIDKLKGLDGQKLPENEEAYLHALDPESFPEAYRQELKKFAAERYRFLQEGGAPKAEELTEGSLEASTEAFTEAVAEAATEGEGVLPHDAKTGAPDTPREESPERKQVGEG